MPSAKAISSGAAGLELSDRPGNDVSTVALLADNGQVSVLPSAMLDGNAWQADLSGVTALPRIGIDPANDNTSQQAPLPDDPETTAGGANGLTFLPTEHRLPRNDGSQDAPPQDSDTPPADDGGESVRPRMGSLFSGTRGARIHVHQVEFGGFDPLQGSSGLKNSFTDGTDLLADGSDAGNGSVSLGGRHLRVISGTLANQGTSGDLPDPLRDGFTIVASPVSFADSLSDHRNAYPVVGRMADFHLAPGRSVAWSEGNGLFEIVSGLAGSDRLGSQWMSGNWTGSLASTPVGGAAAYPDAGTAPHGALTIPSFGSAVERWVNAGAGVGGMDHGSLGLVHPSSLGTEARFETQELLPGHDGPLVEKPTTRILAGPLHSHEILTGSGSSAAADFVRSSEILSLGITALTSAAARSQASGSQGGGHGQDLANGSAGSAPGPPFEANGPLSLVALDPASGFEWFPDEVAATGARSGDSLAGNTSTTSVYLPMEGSSVWSIVTSYALVIVPRQRRYQPTILVVDPDDATRDAMSVVLVRAGYFVLPAASVRDAWGMVRTPNARIDLVLMDPHLPDVSGIHLCARLREFSPTVPVMVCAGEVEPAEVAQLQQLGVRYYLRKPIAFEELLHTVKAILL